MSLGSEAKESIAFRTTLARHGLSLKRAEAKTLQINVGRLCNQTCKHCHIEAEPGCDDVMALHTMNAVISYAKRCDFDTIDITGGAPELNPHLINLIDLASSIVPRVMVRSNLTAICDNELDNLVSFFADRRVVVIGSFPSLDQTQVEFQRGKGVYSRLIEGLRKLNKKGYGLPNSGLELNLVANPTGAFLPPPQKEIEMRFRQVLERKWLIHFNHLYSFANAPLGRFRRWLEHTGNLDTYMQRLVTSFNPCAVEQLMCRALVSVSWDGYLFDCDFNLSKGLFGGGDKIHVADATGPPEQGSAIVTSDHCYACTAGAGFT